MQEVQPDNKFKFKRKATKDPNPSKEESVGSLGSQEVDFEWSMELNEDMEIDDFEVESNPLPFRCHTILVMLPQEFMIQ